MGGMGRFTAGLEKHSYKTAVFILLKQLHQSVSMSPLQGASALHQGVAAR